MAGVGPEDLFGLAQEFLSACVEALDTIPTYNAALDGAPERAFIAEGTPALDCCPQLTVHTATLSEGDSAPTTPKASMARINRVQLVATSVRCSPMQDDRGTPPPADLIEASAEQINADKWALWNHIYNLIVAGDLFDRCCDVIWGGLITLTPSGGCAGNVLTITVCFDGYEEVLST